LLLAAITLLAAFLRLYRIYELPPGDGYDPAFYGLDALEILAGARPVYLHTNLGREALFSYLVALSVALLGVGPPAIYATSAIVGVLTVPAIYFAASEFFASHEGVLSRWGGLLAALATALSYWHLSWSRLGVRAILVPLFAATTMGLLWRGQRTGRRRAYIACGVSLGLSLYTYQAAWLLPALVLLGFVYAARSHSIGGRRGPTRRDLLDLGLLCAAALLIFAPMGVYLLTHRNLPAVRVEQTLVVRPSLGLRGVGKALWSQAVELLSALLVRGDNWPKVNPPGRALVNPFLAIAACLGLIVALARFRRPRYALLLTWLAVMAVPALLASSGPASKRAIGMLPAVMLLIASGCLEFLQFVRRWAARQRPSCKRAVGVLLVLSIAAGFVYGGVRTYRDYFGLWGQDPSLFTYFEAGLSAAGRYVAQRPPEERIYLSSFSPDHPSVAYNSQRRPGVKSYNGRVCLVLADQPPGGATYIVVPAEDEQGVELLQRYLPRGRVVDYGPLHYGQPYFVAFHVPAGASARVYPARVEAVNWGDGLELLGYDLGEERYQAGDEIRVTTYMRATGRPQTNYTGFVHLVGPDNPVAGGPLWAQDDSEPCRRTYPTSSWETDEIVVDHWSLHIPADAPAGEYHIAMGFYQWPSLERLPVLDASGGVVADHVVLRSLQITASR